MVATSREAALGLVDKHHDAGAFERATTLAWTQAQVQLHHLGIDRAAAGQYQRLGGHMMYATPVLRPPSETIWAGASAQSDLWSLGVSGDLPIMLLRVSDIQHLDVAREAIQAFEYWRMKRLATDLIILNDRATSYVQDLQIALETLVRASQSRPQIGDERLAGHVFVLRADLVPPKARAALESVARVVLVGERGSLADQLERGARASAGPARGGPARRDRVRAAGFAGGAGAGVLQRSRRVLRRWPRIYDHAEPRSVDPGPVDQRRGQPQLRLPGVGRRRRLRLVREQPRASAHAVVQRSGDRSPRPGPVHQG